MRVVSQPAPLPVRPQQWRRGSPPACACLYPAPLSPALSRLALLLAQVLPIRPALSDVAFETAFGRIVESLPLHALRKVVLPGEAGLAVVVVRVTGAIALLFHQPGRRIEDMLGRRQAAALSRGLHCRAVGLVGGIRF